MIHKIYTVFDSKAEAYLPPFFMHAEGMAVRIFSDACSDPGHQWGKHPEDYTLFSAGTFDDNTGRINQEALKSVTNGINVVQSKEI